MITLMNSWKIKNGEEEPKKFESYALLRVNKYEYKESACNECVDG